MSGFDDDWDVEEPHTCYICGRNIDGYVTLLCAECRRRGELEEAKAWAELINIRNQKEAAERKKRFEKTRAILGGKT